MSDDLVVLRWPWSFGAPEETTKLQGLEVTIPFEGTAILACPATVQVLPAGGAADLAVAGVHDEWQLYQLPQGQTGSTQTPVDLRAYVAGRHAQVALQFEDARPRFVEVVAGDYSESRESLAVDDWSSAFDELRSKASPAFELVRWADVLRWVGEQRATHEPRRSLIVEIAERLETTIEERCRHMRRILLRQRDYERVERTRQLDAECVRWYARQSGYTLAEKAGPKQRILAVVRKEVFDTQENRVLKEFLARAVRAGRKYVRRFKEQYASSSRLLLVQRFAHLCEGALRIPEFESVGKPEAGLHPNYVLQSDARYREIWAWYQKLLRNQDSEEQVWSWQSRLWDDVARLLLGCACELLRDGDKRALRCEEAPFRISRENKLGRRLGVDAARGPFVLHRGGRPHSVVTVVHPDQCASHPYASPLGGLAATAIVVRQKLGDAACVDVFVLWGLNAMGSARTCEPSVVARTASAALRRVHEELSPSHRCPTRIGGLVLCSAVGDFAELIRSQVRGAHGVDVLSMGSDWQCWDEATEHLAESLERWWAVSP